VLAFTILDSRLHLLLIRRANDPFRGRWALPGGFLDVEEDLEHCAARELMEETGLSGVDLEQLRTFGRPGRDPRERVISVAYYSLLKPEKLDVKPASDAADADWFPVNELPPLAFDHADIIRLARERLVTQLVDTTIAFEFLPETFTLRDIKGVYEILTGAKIDEHNFRRRFPVLEQIEETGELRRCGGTRPARVYRLRQ
jgi:8-oxo-dGTP diphosphatase